MAKDDAERLSRPRARARERTWQKIRRLLHEPPYLWFTAEQIAEDLGCSRHYAGRVLRLLYEKHPEFYERRRGSYRRFKYRRRHT